MKNIANQFLSREQMRSLSQRSNWAGIRGVAHQWFWVVVSFALVYWQANALTIMVAVVVIGTRQLGLAIAQHDGAHRSLAKSNFLNKVLGQWLAAAPVAQDMTLYREHHLRHHGFTGTVKDPDLRLAQGFPIERTSMVRKFLRDISGLTGFKALLGSVLMLARVYRYDVSGGPLQRLSEPRSLAKQIADGLLGLAPFVITNLAIWVLLALFASGWLYLLWVAGFLFVYPWVLRVRSMAEHALTPDPDDALRNSRTTYGRWWEKALYAPLNVNYHLEHHMLPNVPYNRLPEMHKMLKAAGAFDNGGCIEPHYAAVLSKMTSATNPTN